jgi:hypothetical protein
LEKRKVTFDPEDSRKRKRELECFHCKGPHHLRDCPEATEEDKKTLVEKYKSSKTRKVKGYDFELCYEDSMDVDQDSKEEVQKSLADVNVELNGILKVQGCLDSGCESTVVPRAFIDDLILKGSQVKLISTTDTILKPAVEGGQASIARFKAELDLCILTSLEVPVYVRQVDCLICESGLQEILIGEDVQLRLGIHPTKTLEDILKKKISHLESIRTRKVVVEPEVEPYVDFLNQHEDQMDSECDEEDVLRDCIDEMIRDAVLKGFNPLKKLDLRRICFKYKDIFREKLQGDPPAKVTPMKLHRKPGSKPFVSKPRKMPMEMRNFLNHFISDLEECGFIRRNPSSRWASPVMVVPKPGGRGFRVVVDLRGLNLCLEPSAWPMPLLEVVLSSLGGSACFALLDAFKGYWQFPVDEDSQELLSFMTDRGVYTPNRIIQGCMDGVQCFQAGMSEALANLLYTCVLLWVDDILVYSQDCDQHLDNLEKVFQKMQAYGIKLNAKRCMLYDSSVKWCGRIIDKDGVSYDPEYIQGIVDMMAPSTAADLQQFLSAMNWIRNGILDYARLVSPLQDLLLEAETKVQSCKKRTLRNFILKGATWSDEHQKCFDECKQRIAEQVKLAYPKEGYLTCMFPDASDAHWGCILTQIPEEDANKNFEDQRHEIMFISSGPFRGSQLRWSIIEKETWPILQALEKARHLLMFRKFRIFTDHKNLVYILSPHIRESEYKKQLAEKLERWSLKLRAFTYDIEHIDGERNLWADLLSRWGASPILVRSRALKTLPRTASVIHSEDFSWPSLEEIVNKQNGVEPDHSLGCAAVDGVWKSVSGQIWVPTDDLRIRLLVIAHMGMSGHRRKRNTTGLLKEKFILQQLRMSLFQECGEEQMLLQSPIRFCILTSCISTT